MVIGEENPFSSLLFHESLDLGVLELDDLLLPTIHPAGENQQDEVPWSEDGVHGLADTEDGLILRELTHSQQARVGAVTSAEIEEPSPSSGAEMPDLWFGGVF